MDRFDEKKENIPASDELSPRDKKKGKESTKKKTFTVALVSVGLVLVIAALLWTFVLPPAVLGAELSLYKNLSCDTEFDLISYSKKGSAELGVSATKFVTGYEDMEGKITLSHDRDRLYASAVVNGDELVSIYKNKNEFALSSGYFSTPYGATYENYDSELSRTPLAPRSDSEYALGEAEYELLSRLDDLLSGEARRESREAMKLLDDALRHSDIRKNSRYAFGAKDFGDDGAGLKGRIYTATTSELSALLLDVAERVEDGDNERGVRGLVRIADLFGGDIKSSEALVLYLEELSETITRRGVSLRLENYYSGLRLAFSKLVLEYETDDGDAVCREIYLSFGDGDGIEATLLETRESDGNTVTTESAVGLRRVDEEDSKTVHYEFTNDTVVYGDDRAEEMSNTRAVIELDPEENTSYIELTSYKNGKKQVKLTLDGYYEDTDSTFAVSFDRMVVNSIEISDCFELSLSLSRKSQACDVPEYESIGELTEARIEDELVPMAKRFLRFKNYFGYIKK